MSVAHFSFYNQSFVYYETSLPAIQRHLSFTIVAFGNRNYSLSSTIEWYGGSILLDPIHVFLMSADNI
jgi:hypothetical protein